MQFNHSEAFSIGRWRVDPLTNRLSDGAEEVLLPPKAMLALQFLATDPLKPKSHEELMTAIWGTQVVSEASLYQLIALLRKSLGDTQSPRQYIEKVSGKGYRLIAEVTSERSSLPNIQEPPKRITRKWGVITLFAVLLFTGILGGVFSLFEWQSSSESKRAKNIAEVDSLLFTAFRPYQENSELDYITLGLSDSVRARLSELDNLKVITYRKSMKEADIPESLIAQSVDSVLSGFVQREAGRLRVVVQIFDSKTSDLLWTKVFDGRENAAFTLQDEIASQLLNVFSKRPINNIASFKVTDKVYQDYLLGRFYWSKRQVDSLNQAENLFSRLMSESPNFPLTYVGMCDTYMFYSIYGNWQTQKANDLCAPLLDKALQLDPELGPAYTSKGQLLAARGQYDKARLAYENAIKFAPNYALTYLWYGDLLRNLGEVETAYVMVKKALELDPLSPIVNRQLAFTYLNLGRFSDAASAYQRALVIESDYTDRPVDELNFLPLNVQRATDFLIWVKDNPQRISHIDVHKLPYAAVLMSVGKKKLAENTLAAYGEKFTDHQFFLFLKAAIAFEKGQPLVALNFLEKRSQRFKDNPNLSNSYIGALAYLGQKREALTVFQSVHGTQVDGGIRLEALNENNYRVWLLYDELLAINGVTDDLGFRTSVNAYLKENFDSENLFHLLWLHRKGQRQEALQLGKLLLASGWLPDHNNEFLSKQLFRQIFEGDSADLKWFDKILAKNQQSALSAANFNEIKLLNE
ncbi:hypothetical protein FLL45_14925 [Aliikangiella marina]|uniref:OmpR/PhoB-type domain-containing protein n=1 Tax=Aliikangiella marina TaxID=1712262 RepID=A0A545T6B9_9GAMM|nr:tetratricopeptide repeat protein [Aliikangiella marina]TQV72763.1 hypothetical protein FLL45_14925 [Aliikangiella marina]